MYACICAKGEGRHTRKSKENQPVYDQDGPEDGQIEDLEPTAEESNSNRLGR